MLQLTANDGSMRWRVWFGKESRDVWARSAEAAIKTATQGQVTTNAPRNERTPRSIQRVRVNGPHYEGFDHVILVRGKLPNTTSPAAH